MQIEIRRLRKVYHDADRELTVIEDLTASFPGSGSIAIVGRSGVGKSTLLHLLGGLDSPTSGSVEIGGTDLAKLSDAERSTFRRTNVGFIFQSHHLLPEFSALENVMMPLTIAGLKDIEARERASVLLERVGLSGRVTHRPGQLSGGEQQRVAICRAIVTHPKVVLADEPTGNLDFHTARSVQELMFELQRELKNLLVVVTHSRELAESMDMTFEMLPGGELEREIRGER